MAGMVWCGIVEFNPLTATGNYSATSNNMKLIYWPLMGSLLHSLQRLGVWAGRQPAQAPHRCTKCNSQVANPSTASLPIIILLYKVRCSAVSMCPLKD